MRRESEGGSGGDASRQAGEGEGEGEDRDVLTQMIQALLQDADTPPKEVEGVSEEFCDSRSSCLGSAYRVLGAELMI